LEVKNLEKLIIKIKGGEKASRINPIGYNKQKEIVLSNKARFVGKHLSLKTVYSLFGILSNLKTLLKIWTSGEIASASAKQ